MDNLKKLELTITAFKQSMSLKVADYEEQIASIRAEASLLIEENNVRIAQLEEELSVYRKDIKEDDVVVVPKKENF